MAARKNDQDGRADEEGRTILDRLTFLLELHNRRPDDRGPFIASRGLTIEQVEAWRLEAQRYLKYLPGLKRRRSK